MYCYILDPSSISSCHTLYTPVYSMYCFILDPSSISSFHTLYTPVYSMYCYILDPSSISSCHTIYTPVYSMYCYILDPSSISSCHTIYTPVYSMYCYILDPSSISSCHTIYTPVYSMYCYILDPSSILFNCIHYFLCVFRPQFMRCHGNKKARDEYEAVVPPFYYKPTEKDCRVLREQWIRAKYERREFISNKKSLYAVDYKEGFLWKKGRDNGQFLKRLFIFSESEGLLKYYTKEKRFEPKGTFAIKSLNAMFQCEKMKHEHGLEITCVHGGRTRSVYVYHEDGAEIVTWYNVLRSARFRYLKKAFPDVPEQELIPKITRSYTKCGYMEKTGPTKEPFKKRWFNLDSEERKLLYYKKPLDPYEQGRVFIGSSEAGYQVTGDLPSGMRGKKWEAGITIRTPQREFIFTCENIKEQKEWLQELREVASRPMSAHDTAEEAAFRKAAQN
ncbi:arf-GAP with dual PH domain-containing protein 2-like isoform X2 [Bufo gargarizans]|uniref:arf-GAP with dual PH domain-containing protein 2-like isoform X2 n=1 Tax=Bufo gargarizans TaxID=30331 RepID=UPI001CF332E4|nr:arf-GAP with dual PH domain-containing protein 2-like isoform X2 [Bufo gargarizans]